VDQTILTTGAAVLLILVAGVFAALDAALSTVSVARVEEMAKEPRYGAARLSLMLLNRPRYINVTVLLHLLSLIAGVVLLTVVFAEVIESTVWALVGVIAVTTIAAYVVAGVGPRTLGRQHAYSLALGASTPMRVLGMVLGPVASLLVGVGNAVTPGRGFRNGPFASEIELLEIVDMARERGVVADDESRMIQSVFELGDTTAREVMTPRTEMVWIESDKTVGQAARLTVKSGYSRIPVVDGDNSDDVVGVIYLRDIVARLDDPDGRAAPVADVMRPAVFVPDAKRIDDLLSEMQRDHNHLAILVDEYGGTAGLVSIEDILEEIVGEITDEYDKAENEVEDLDDGSFRVSSRFMVDDLEDLCGVAIDDDDVDTLGGLMAKHLGRVPIPGSVVEADGLRFEAEGLAGRRNRISTVVITALTGAAPDDQGAFADAYSEPHA
jgi:CBS domain containing-hemolysin-like protein